MRLQAWDILCELLFADGETSDSHRLQACEGNERLQAELVGLANSCFVTAALWKALRERGLASRLSDAVCDYLSSFYELNAERNNAVLDQLAECIGALNRRGISPMPLKGTAHLLSGMYADPAERFLSDIDLLIPANRITEASIALAEIGFIEAQSDFDYSRHHHLPVLVRTLDDAAVELHSAPVAKRAENGLNVSEVWASASNEKGADVSWCLASATDTAMLAFLHGEVMDGYLARCIMDLRGYLDLRRLIRHRGADIDWRINLGRVKACRASRAFRRYLHVFECLTGQALLPSLRPTLRDRSHYLLLRQAIVWPAIQHLATQLAHERIRQRYACGPNPLAVNAYRIRALGTMIRNRTVAWARRYRDADRVTDATRARPGDTSIDPSQISDD
jgi:hypothetical protein